MNQSFGSWMLTGGIHGELREEARQQQHLRTFRELQSERRATRTAARNAAIADAVSRLRAWVAGRPAQTSPDCCPA